MSEGAAPQLIAAWQQHISTDTQLLDAVVRRYREKHRRYHGVAHLNAVVAHVEDLIATGTPDGERLEPPTIIAAAVYHDAIYEPQSPANERASARLAYRDLTTLGWAPDRIDRVVTMIEGTTNHLDPPDLEASILFDADLAILAAPASSYGDYVANVRAEYTLVPDDSWRIGRASVLRGFLDRTAIYATEVGRHRWQEAAQANLLAELASIEAPATE